MYATTAKKAHSGEAARAFHDYFRNTIGFGDPPEHAQEHEPLVANLVAACMQLSKACEKYADHIEHANIQILNHKAEPFRIEAPWDSPIFGGNGDDGGLHSAVTRDGYIHRLGDVAYALDSAQAKVRLPGGGPSGGGMLPFIPGLRPGVPVPMVPASFTTAFPAASPHNPAISSRDPIPPDPTTKLLDPAEQAQFRTWMNSLNAGGFASGGDQMKPDNAYQLRTAGYPERELPLGAAATGRSGKGLMADGLRPADGYAVEAKYVRKPDCPTPSTFRSIDALNKTLGTPPKLDGNGNPKFDPRRDGMFPGDERELKRYKAAMEQSSELRGLEIVTNDKNATAYWQSMMLMSGVNGTARYIP
ncbi:restriction endonuclease fold toxin-2 domain-containing protein [Streptomyces triculaminicus]|uniref:restriction endonuclease fold toxin-2 domain-containing protein n=1 Tax=Streptomyces triculaminicus TaxID=2816232 RepID=UPI003404F1B5